MRTATPAARRGFGRQALSRVAPLPQGRPGEVGVLQPDNARAIEAGRMADEVEDRAARRSAAVPGHGRAAWGGFIAALASSGPAAAPEASGVPDTTRLGHAARKQFQPLTPP